MVPVLIIGAGPTGLTLACELFRHGVPCRIIDALPEPSPYSKALAIHARTMELFEKTGVVDEFLAAGWPLRAFNVYKRRKHIVRMAFDELESAYPFVLSLPQSETERILGARLAALGGRVERGVRLTGLEQQDRAAEARLMGADGSEEQVTCQWIVGCDGAHSSVRHLLGLEFEGAKYEQYYMLADVEFDTSFDVSEFYLFSDRNRLAGFHPFSAVGARIFADLDLCPNGVESVTLQDVQDYLDLRGPGLVTVKKLNWLSTFFVHRRQVRSYRVGRVFLAGDAAHVHSPASGQGMNTGIQDAFNLAWKLALVKQHRAPSALLDSYEPERHRAGRSTLRMTDFFSRLNTLRNPMAQAARDIFGPILARNKMLGYHYRNAVAELSVNYRRTPLVREYVEGRVAGRAPRPGDRAPDGIVLSNGRKMRLFDLMRDTRHHLLVFGGKVEEWVSLESSSTKVHFIADGDESLFQRYGGRQSAAYLVRPDGYIAYRCIPALREAYDHTAPTLPVAN